MQNAKVNEEKSRITFSSLTLNLVLVAVCVYLIYNRMKDRDYILQQSELLGKMDGRLPKGPEVQKLIMDGLHYVVLSENKLTTTYIDSINKSIELYKDQMTQQAYKNIRYIMDTIINAHASHVEEALDSNSKWMNEKLKMFSE